MQPDRRHELERNDLADSATELVERIRPHLWTVGLTAAALLLGFAAWTLVDSRRIAAREESWEACLEALGTGQAIAIDGVATRYPGTPAAQWSRLVLADGLLEQGSQLLYVDRGQAEQRLQSAAATYAGLLATRPTGIIAERATFGLAKSRENLGSLDEALRGYDALVREYPDSVVRPFAEARIAALGKDATRQWYDWFSQQKAVPPANVDGATPAATPPADAAPPAGAEAGGGTDAPG